METRRGCSIAWAVLIVVAVLSAVLDQPVIDVIVWFLGLPLLLLTARALRGATDERLHRPVIYYVTAGALLALTVGGALLATVPGASDISTLCAVYFAPLAWFAYRALVARDPGRALAVAALAQVFAPLFLFVAAIGSMGCKCGGYHAPPWTDTATFLALLGTLPVTMALAGVALVAFRPRDSALPEARARAILTRCIGNRLPGRVS